MSRTRRLLDLIQILRGHRFPIAGERLAEQLGISLRTLYRDIRSLQEQGAHIDGAPGLGYLLRPGFMLPPLMFSEEEIEALVLVAWCELRQGFRHFRTDHISAMETLPQRYPRRRQALLKAWREQEGLLRRNPTADKN
ncbi:YafY family protein [Bordetella sp. FB-8]|uniref:helix-turn-helix transcriptional regulator n=1 Tax=Bordetella sp. FB-8 TaxID=1159870 RepID=UPI00035C5BAB|nr:HTH domain-containing protein [Bordetella sp. FB-8]